MVQADVMRPYNLDYLDVETMEYYLTAPRHEYDIAVLFYAQWCQNCHAFAPIWDKIGRLHKAGTLDSKLIMGLFDCEADSEHSRVCNKAGVKHYPTITFFSLSGQVFHSPKQKPTKRNPFPSPPHGVRFAGNWQYGDAVYDWLVTMSELSAWHRAGWGRKLRSFLFGGRNAAGKDAKKKLQLPLGIPSGGGGGGTTTTTTATASKATAGSSSSSSDSSLDLLLAEKKAKDLETKMVALQELTLRGSVMLGSLLHPATVHKSLSAYVAANASLIPATLMHDVYGGKKNYTDAFRFLSETGGWTSSNETAAAEAASSGNEKKNKDKQDEQQQLMLNEDWVLRSCVLEVALDYCTRVTTQLTLEWLDRQYHAETDDADADSMLYQSLEDMEKELLRIVEQTEPYCVLVESCIVDAVVVSDPKCRPETCPFVDPIACRYASTCFEPEVQVDYAKALQVTTTASLAARAMGKDQTKTATTTSTSAAGSSSSSDDTKTKSGGGWGLF